MRSSVRFRLRSTATPNGRQRRRGAGPRRQPQAAKDKSTERIDGIVALIMAIGRAMVVQEEPQPSYQMIIL